MTTYADQILIRDYVQLQLRIARDKLGPEARHIDTDEESRRQRVRLGQHFRRLSHRKREAERRRLNAELDIVRKLDREAIRRGEGPVNLATFDIDMKETP